MRLIVNDGYCVSKVVMTYYAIYYFFSSSSANLRHLTQELYDSNQFSRVQKSNVQEYS